MVKPQQVTRNITKSGEAQVWSGFRPFHLHLVLIVNSSQSASYHIATVVGVHAIDKTE